jgi:hypothetical protein
MDILKKNSVFYFNKKKENENILKYEKLMIKMG